MKKSILLELALCILQEIGSFGVDRAKSLRLKVVKTSSAGKQIVIDKDQPAPEFPLTPADESALKELLDIDEAVFCLSDSLGRSPDVKVHSGQGRTPPYLPPDECGYFTPKKSAKKSLSKSFEASAKSKQGTERDGLSAETAEVSLPRIRDGIQKTLKLKGIRECSVSSESSPSNDA